MKLVIIYFLNVRIFIFTIKVVVLRSYLNMTFPIACVIMSLTCKP